MSLDASWPWHSVLPGDSWDQQIYQRDGHFLQTTHWAAFQQSMGREVYFAEGPGWQAMAIMERAGENARLYCPYGPVAEDGEAFTAAVAALRALGEKHGVLFIRSEPWAPVAREDVAALGFFPARNLQPALTWVQDLDKTRDQLFGEFSANNRNRFRNAHKKGLSITSSTDVADVEILLDMIHDVSNNTGMLAHDDDYYRHQAKALLERNACTLYVARHHDKSVAAAIVYDSETTRYYAHSGSLLEARNLHPGGPMLATMVLDAQERGQKVFDFMGAAPEDQPDHPWAGFTMFKQSFGGRYRAYLGTWEMPITDQERFAGKVSG